MSLTKTNRTEFTKICSFIPREPLVLSRSQLPSETAATVINCLDIYRKREVFTRNSINIVMALQDDYDKERRICVYNVHVKICTYKDVFTSSNKKRVGPLYSPVVLLVILDDHHHHRTNQLEPIVLCAMCTTTTFTTDDNVPYNLSFIVLSSFLSPQVYQSKRGKESG